MKKIWLTNSIAIGLLLLSGNVFAQQKNEFSVKQAVDYGMKNTVQVKNALLDVKIQEQVNRQITSAAYPQISGSIGTTNFIDIPVQSLPNFISPATYQVLVNEGVKDGSGNTIVMPNASDFGTISAPFGVPWTANAGVDVSQLLFDGQVFVGLKARAVVLDFYKKTAEVTQEQIKANIYKIYYQLVVGNKQITSLDANIVRFEKLLNDTREIYKNGFAEKLDVDKVSVQLNNLKTEKLKAENMIAVGNSGLKFLMGMPQKDQLILTDTLSEEELKMNILDSNYDYKNRKEFQLLSIAEKLGKYNISRYKLSKLPTVAAFGNYSKTAQRNKFDFFGDRGWFTSSLVGLKISVPIFDGNKKNALIQQSKYELQKTQNNIEQLKLNIDTDVEQSRLKMTSAILTVDNQKQNIVLAETVYNTTKLKYEQGLGSNQEIYNAQTELKVAQTNYYSALYDAINAKIDWLKAAGKL
jgi:outer membrane protein